MTSPTTSSQPPHARTPGTVAVIIPCFNDGATLYEAVRSALSQERIDDLVVVDDGSTDQATLEVIRQLESEGVTVARRPNGGLGAARMTGVEATNSDYVLCLDADDRLLLGALSALAQTLDEDPSLTLAWGDYQLFGERSWRQMTSPTLDPWQVSYQNDMPASMMIRRSALLATGGWKLRGGYEDWDLLMALAERGAKGRRVPVIVYEYRQHGVRMAGEAVARHADIYKLLRYRHPVLFAQRRSNWRSSQAPLALKLGLPAIFALPLHANHRRLLGGAVCHIAHRRGFRLLLRRARSEAQGC